jgi:hypothetical protein
MAKNVLTAMKDIVRGRLYTIYDQFCGAGAASFGQSGSGSNGSGSDNGNKW